jgi:hypothetical protein
MTRRPRCDAHQRLVVAERGEHEAAQVGEGRAHLATDRDAVAIRKPHIENGNIGLAGRDTAEGLLGRSGFAHHLHVLFVFQQLSQTASNDLMVIEQKYFDRSRRLHHRKSIERLGVTSEGSLVLNGYRLRTYRPRSQC